jgi:hypothetical protein
LNSDACQPAGFLSIQRCLGSNWARKARSVACANGTRFPAFAAVTAFAGQAAIPRPTGTWLRGGWLECQPSGLLECQQVDSPGLSGVTPRGAASAQVADACSRLACVAGLLTGSGRGKVGAPRFVL